MIVTVADVLAAVLMVPERESEPVKLIEPETDNVVNAESVPLMDFDTGLD